MKKKHFSSIREYHDYFGMPAPEHPLISVSSVDSDASCVDEEIELSTDFYAISLKHIIEGEIHYGRTQYDFKGGSLLCMSPRQIVRIAKLNIKSDARTILIHEDFLRGTSIQKTIESANYFTYAVNEALHLSPREEGLVKGLLDALEQEYSQNHDAFSKDIMVSQLATLLSYTDRFYQRQFQQRMESPMSSLEDRFFSCLKALATDHIPSVEEIADKLHVTPRYLSDGLKVETGKTALENIHAYQIERAKNMLLGSDDSVATIAYALGFEYPQYFARLFKKKVGKTPTQFRNQVH
ncbi:response regulator transcription factor [Alteromonas sp. KUL49]|uniref:helix-turn-helix domain-containing protein n=1 Tax=Alteromonas sp. KUL49 TaxID=2480798 RepID=UPI00102F1777|nr:response regulator transcription factor [Alteromonas sp. KUL49]TAP35508.1 AraC family transcriptional regulator [Alteromonas sp. KUL49]GEA13387.1 AraC family transcriptional regulator [Alteromonas sp. KUL49]